MDKYKKCSKCGELKSLEDFYVHKQAKGGYRPDCKVCKKKRDAIWRTKHKEYVKEYLKQWNILNHESVRSKHREYEKANPDKKRAFTKTYYLKHKDHVTAKNEIWRKSNPSKIRAILKKSNAKHRSTPTGALNNIISSRMSRSLCGHKNHQRWEKLVNYNVNQLKAHLEKQFKYGMSWDNYGLWHVDHIIPVTAFNFEKPEDLDFKKCWDLKNLQPLWAVENLKKNNKLTKPYQPSLLLSVW